MSKLGMDLSKFKKVGSDEKSTILKHVKDGHEIRVYHDSVEPKVLEGLKKLSVHNFADGGEVDPITEEEILGLQSDQPIPAYIDRTLSQNPIVASVNSFIDDNPDIKDIVGPDDEEEEVLTDQPAPSVEPAKGIGQVQSSGLMPSGSQTKVQPSSLLQQSMDDQIAGATKMADAQIGLANDTQKIEAEKLKKQVEEKEAFEKRMIPIQAENDALSKWIEANPINSKRYMEKMSTGGKIQTTIGLLLGGIGAGMTHGPNLAAKYLDDQIDRDIDEQKNQLSTKKGLLAYNLQKMGNYRDAYNMTKMQTNDIVASQLQMAASKASTTAAAGSMQQVIGKIKQQNLILMSKMASSGVSKDSQKMIQEVQSRKSNIDLNLNKAIQMIEKKGTYETTGAHNDNLNRIMDQVAVDMAKLQDPNSVARPEEVELVKKGLVESGMFQRDKTALEKLKAFKNEVNSRAKIAYDVRGITPPSSVAQGNEVQRYDPKTKKTAIFDANSKKFLRYE